MIKTTAETKPFLASLIIRGLYVLDGIKDYTLIVLDIPFKYFLSSSFIVNTFYIMKNVLIGYQLKEIGELLTHQKQWDDIDTPEKIFFMLVILMIVFSFSATVVFTVWAQKRIKGIFPIPLTQEIEKQKSQKVKEIEITMKSGSNLISSQSEPEF